MKCDMVVPKAGEILFTLELYSSAHVCRINDFISPTCVPMHRVEPLRVVIYSTKLDSFTCQVEWHTELDCE